MMILIEGYAIAVTLLIGVALFTALVRYFGTALSFQPQKKQIKWLLGGIHHLHDQRAPFLRVLLHCVAAVLLSRALIWLVGCAGSALTGELESFWGRQEYLLRQWDAGHYLGIAENGYATEGDARFHIVFYPLYPLLVRMFLPLFCGNTLFCAVTISNICLIASGVVLFRLVELTSSEKRARWSLWLFMFCPAGMFFSVAYTESLFFLLTILCVYLARRRRFAWALLFGSLSAFTRLPGVVCAAAVFYEMLRAQRENGGKLRPRLVIRDFFLCALVLSGFLAYLAVNHLVTGNAFQFLIYQKEHWGQTAGNILQTARYTAYYAVYPNVDWYQWGIWIPQTAALILTALVIFFSQRRAHPGDLAYSLAYFIAVVSPTMLLSGTRYLCAMYPLYPMLARLCLRRRSRWLVLIPYGAMFVYCAWMFMGKTILL